MSTQIGKWIANLVVAALAAVDTFFISKIKNPTVAQGLRLSLQPARETAVALGDDNPRNAEQVEEIWKRFANSQLPTFAEGEIQTALELVADEDVKIVLATLSRPVVNLLRVATDEDPDNRAQVRALFDAFVKDPATQEVALEHLLVPVIESRIKDESLRAFLLAILRNGIVIGDGDGQKVA